MTSQSYIPTEAYRYRPKPSDIKVDGSRLLFDGNLQLDKQEANAVSQFRVYAARNHYNLKSYWNDNKILRFLQACGFKNEKALNSIREFTTWRETKLPIKTDSKLEKFLNSGLLYIHGRDHKFRPIVVFNIYQLDPKTADMDLVVNALTFWFEYIIDEWMLPGQVENWVFIINLKGMGLAAMAVQSVRKLFAYLQDNYKCRLYKMYLINASASIQVPWSIAKKFLDGDTVEKVNFCKSQVPSGLFSHANRSQVEEKFGGNAPNVSQFWPPIIPSNEYFVLHQDAQNLISREEYVAMYKSGALAGMKVDPAVVEEVNKEKQQKNKESFVTPGDTPCGNSQKLGHASAHSFGSLADTVIEDNDEDADFIEYMSEGPQGNQSTNKIRDFEAAFISALYPH